MASEQINFMQAVGGICYAHGPYQGRECPMLTPWRHANLAIPCPCTSDPQKPEYVTMAEEQMRETNKVYTQAQLDTATQSAFDAGLEEAARLICLYCREPKGYSAPKPSGDEYVHRAIEGYDVMCCAGPIRSRIGSRDDQENKNSG